MLTLYHHPFCPQSRAVRIALGEYGLFARLIEERVWERRNEFLALNPANTLPVLLDPEGRAVIGLRAALDFLDETRGEGLGDHRLMPRDPLERAEIRRLIDWFTDGFGQEVTAYLVGEKLLKRLMRSDQGGGAPDVSRLKAGAQNIRTHLKYIGYLALRRNWLAGPRMSHADLVAAAHLSTVDYLGDVPWSDFESAKDWYVRIKSRPSFRAILADRATGIQPAPSYSDLDF